MELVRVNFWKVECHGHDTQFLVRTCTLSSLSHARASSLVVMGSYSSSWAHDHILLHLIQVKTTTREFVVDALSFRCLFFFCAAGSFQDISLCRLSFRFQTMFNRTGVHKSFRHRETKMIECDAIPWFLKWKVKGLKLLNTSTKNYNDRNDFR